MEVTGSPDIFQEIFYELMGNLEGSKACLDDILVLKKVPFHNIYHN